MSGGLGSPEGGGGAFSPFRPPPVPPFTAPAPSIPSRLGREEIKVSQLPAPLLSTSTSSAAFQPTISPALLSVVEMESHQSEQGPSRAFLPAHYLVIQPPLFRPFHFRGRVRSLSRLLTGLYRLATQSRHGGVGRRNRPNGDTG